MKPELWSKERAESFLDQNTVKAYRFRAPYPDETFRILEGLIKDKPRVVLDVGCGTGAVARNLVDFVERIDALDPSAAMIEEGKKMPGGDHPKIRWILGKAEDTELSAPYALVTAGMSIHWMDWDIISHRFLEIMTPNANLAIINTEFSPLPWDEELRVLRSRYSKGSYQGIKPPKVIDELEKNGRFARTDESKTEPYILIQSVSDYIEQLHSRSDMARVRIGKRQADRFDEELRELLAIHLKENNIEIEVRARIVWGKPIC